MMHYERGTQHWGSRLICMPNTKIIARNTGWHGLETVVSAAVHLKKAISTAPNSQEAKDANAALEGQG